MKHHYSLIIFATVCISSVFGQTSNASNICDPHETIIYETNSQHTPGDLSRDSITYLLEQARLKQPVAYEILAECYRYGNGIGKSLCCAIECYNNAGLSSTNIMRYAYEENPQDELGLLNHIMEGMMAKELPSEEIIAIMSSLQEPKPQWCLFLDSIFKSPEANRKDYIWSSIVSDNATADEIFVGCVMIELQEPDFLKSRMITLGENKELFEKFCKKIPSLYNELAASAWLKYKENQVENQEYCIYALDLMHKADCNGFLSFSNMNEVLSYCEENEITDNFPFSEEDLSRFKILCIRN